MDLTLLHFAGDTEGDDYLIITPPDKVNQLGDEADDEGYVLLSQNPLANPHNSLPIGTFRRDNG